MRKKILCCSLLLTLTACEHVSFWQNRKDQEAQLAAETPQEKANFQNAQKLLALGQCDDAIENFQEFQTQYPQSIYKQASRLGEAQCYEQKGEIGRAHV